MALRAFVTSLGWLITLAATSESLLSMTVNLASPYSPIPSRPRNADVTFFAPGHESFLFGHKDEITLVCLPFKRALSLEWALSYNTVSTPLTHGAADPSFDNNCSITIPKDQLQPGFYDLKVKVKLSDTETVEGQTTFGWDVDHLPVFPEQPRDFAAFWQTKRAELQKIDPKPQWALEKTLKGSEIGDYNTRFASLPQNYDSAGCRFDAVEIYRIHFSSYDGKTIEGWFTKPVGPGPFPALLILPGAGNFARPAPVEHARHGYAALDIQVHGNPVDAAHYEPAPDDKGATRIEQFAHVAIYLHALQAARALRQLPGVNSDQMAVLGGSQGGRLSLVVAAFDPSFKAAIPAIAHFGYYPWRHWVSEQNESKENGGAGFAVSPHDPDSAAPQGYLDILNFAPLVHCPVLMNAGLTDPISPPTTIFAVYERLGGPKKIIPLPNCGHDWRLAFDRAAWRWLEAILPPAGR